MNYLINNHIFLISCMYNCVLCDLMGPHWMKYNSSFVFTNWQLSLKLIPLSYMPGLGHYVISSGICGIGQALLSMGPSYSVTAPATFMQAMPAWVPVWPELLQPSYCTAVFLLYNFHCLHWNKARMARPIFLICSLCISNVSFSRSDIVWVTCNFNKVHCDKVAYMIYKNQEYVSKPNIFTFSSPLCHWVSVKSAFAVSVSIDTQFIITEDCYILCKDDILIFVFVVCTFVFIYVCVYYIARKLYYISGRYPIF